MMRSYVNRSKVKTARGCANAMPDGFTLIEVLIAMAIFASVLGAIYALFISSSQSYHTQDRVVSAQQGVRVGIDFIVRDIRMAGLDPLETAGSGIEQATATKLRFTSDMHVDGAIEEAFSERITYEYDAGNNRLRQCLYEGTASESWETLVDNVSALTFTYLDADGTVTATLADIRTVVISMTTQGVDAQGQAFTRALNTRVRCRNL